jgi:hypothetical protein
MPTSKSGFNRNNPRSCKRFIIRELTKRGFTDALVSAQIRRELYGDSQSAATVYVNIGSAAVPCEVLTVLKALARERGFALTDFTY